MTVQTLQKSIIERLRADSTLMSYLSGGIWARKIKQNTAQAGKTKTPGSTPEAFDENHNVKPCLYVSNGTENLNPIGPLSAMYTFPTLYFRCQPKDSDKEFLNLAFERVYDLLHDQTVRMPAGTGCKLRIMNRVGQADDETEMPNTVVDVVRIQGDGLWRVQL